MTMIRQARRTSAASLILSLRRTQPPRELLRPQDGGEHRGRLAAGAQGHAIADQLEHEIAQALDVAAQERLAAGLDLARMKLRIDG